MQLYVPTEEAKNTYPWFWGQEGYVFVLEKRCDTVQRFGHFRSIATGNIIRTAFKHFRNLGGGGEERD